MTKHRDTFKFCTNCATQLTDKGEFKQCPKCHKYYFFNAKPTVTVIVSNDKDEILLTKRAREPFKDWWDLPGGFVEEDESLEQAAQRELEEETGLKIGQLQYVGSVAEDYHFEGEIFSIVAAIFTGKVPGDAKVTVADDVIDYVFVPKQEIDPEKIAFDNQREFFKKQY